MRCPNCAEEIRDTAKVCGYCGEPLAVAGAPDPTLDAAPLAVELTGPTAAVAEEAPRRETVTAGVRRRQWYLAVRVWAAVALIGVTWLVDLMWATVWFEDTPYRWGIWSFNLADLVGMANPDGFWFPLAWLLVLPSIAVLLVERFARPAVADSVVRAVGSFVLVVVALLVVQLASGGLDQLNFSGTVLTLGSNPGPWVTAFLALGCFVPARRFRGEDGPVSS